MRFEKKNIYCIVILTIVQLGQVCAETIDETSERYRQNQFGRNPDDGGGKLLSRKRRFLSFPEGSSFQVVYDQTIPIVGSTLLYTVGVTVAAAWQLPNVSPFEVLRLLREKIAGGSLLRRTDQNVNSTTLIDTSTSSYDQYNKHSFYYTAQNNQSNYAGTSGTKNILNNYYNTHAQQQTAPGGSNRINYYTNGNDNVFGGQNNKYGTKPWPQLDSNALYDSFPPSFVPPFNSTRNDWGGLVSRYIQAWIRRHPPDYPITSKRYYPVFGKRSIDEHTHPEDKYFLEHHRATRHQLYRKIETFLEGQSKHGHHCVLRALCESGQRKNQKKPESFLREILKAIFSLPSTHDLPVDYTHRTYDEAHAHTGDCEDRYPFCKDSIWSDDFVF